MGARISAGRSRQTLRAGLVLGVVLTLIGISLPVGAALPHQRTQVFSLAHGVSHEVWRLSDSSADVHVGVVPAASRAELRIVSARGGVADGLESVSSMCRRTPGCILGVNGDYFTGDGAVGGVIAGGRMLRSPTRGHEQLSLNPLSVAPSGLEWSGVVVGGSRRVVITQVNRPPGEGQVALYTSAHGPGSPSWGAGTRELALRGAGAQLGRVGHTVGVLTDGWSEGGSELSARRGVLVGRGSGVQALEEVARAGRGQLKVRIHMTPGSRENLGAHPIIMRGGKRVAYSRTDPNLVGRHPRTAIGWDGQGRVVVVVADGRQRGGPGLTADETVSLLQRLGAGAGVLADGGGSSTFIKGGQVVNEPSDGQERLVANAILVVGPVVRLAPKKAAAVQSQPKAAPPAQAPVRPAAPKTAPPPVVAAPAVVPPVVVPPPAAVPVAAAPPSPARALRRGELGWEPPQRWYPLVRSPRPVQWREEESREDVAGAATVAMLLLALCIGGSAWARARPRFWS